MSFKDFTRGDSRIDWFSLKPWDRHSGILVVAGVAYMVIGGLYILDVQSQTQYEAMYYALRIMSFNAWGCGFILIGLTSILSARWPNWPKAWGYVVLTGWSSAWSMFFIAGALLTEARIVYFSMGALWALLAFLWWAVSGLVSPSKNEEVL